MAIAASERDTLTAAREELQVGFATIAADARWYMKHRELEQERAALAGLDVQLSDLDATVLRTQEAHAELRRSIPELGGSLDRQLQALMDSGPVIAAARERCIREIERLEDELEVLERQATGKHAALASRGALDPDVAELMPPAVLEVIPRHRFRYVERLSGSALRNRRCSMLRARVRNRASRRRVTVRAAAARSTADPDGDSEPPGAHLAAAGGVS